MESAESLDEFINAFYSKRLSISELRERRIRAIEEQSLRHQRTLFESRSRKITSLQRVTTLLSL